MVRNLEDIEIGLIIKKGRKVPRQIIYCGLQQLVKLEGKTRVKQGFQRQNKQRGTSLY